MKKKTTKHPTNSKKDDEVKWAKLLEELRQRRAAIKQKQMEEQKDKKND